MRNIAKPMHLQEERGNVIFSAVALIRNRLFTQARSYSPSQAVMIARTINLLKQKKTLLIFPVGIHVNVGGIKEDHTDLKFKSK